MKKKAKYMDSLCVQILWSNGEVEKVFCFDFSLKFTLKLLSITDKQYMLWILQFEFWNAGKSKVAEGNGDHTTPLCVRAGRKECAVHF